MQSRYTIRLKNPLIRICPYIIHLQYFGCRTCVLQCLDDAVVRLEICFCIGKIPSNVHFNKSLLALLFDATATDTVSVKRCSTTQPSSDCVGRRFLEHDFADKALLHEHAVCFLDAKSSRLRSSQNRLTHTGQAFRRMACKARYSAGI